MVSFPIQAAILEANVKQASESRLYQVSDDTKAKLRKFRLGTSRAKDPQAVICTTPNLVRMNLTDCDEEDQIDKKTLEISQADDEVYKNMVDLADELPDNSPRFVLLSYPLTLVCLVSSWYLRTD